MKFHGDINIFLSCLGLREGDSKILEAISIIAMDFDIENYDLSGATETNYLFPKSGVDMVFEDGRLTSIFFYIKPINRYKSYPFLVDLIKGIDNLSSKDTFVKLYGEPDFYQENWIKFNLNGKYLHIEFDQEDRLNLITLFID